MGDSTVNIEYVAEPYYYKKFIDTHGFDRAADILGYHENSLRQYYDGRRKVRKSLEFACEQYFINVNRDDEKEKIFFFTAVKDSKEFTAIDTMAKAMGINIQAL